VRGHYDEWRGNFLDFTRFEGLLAASVWMEL
jgi:hypothetical protein